MEKLKDKVAIITGSRHGIGLKIAEVFAENGAKVVINGRKLEEIEETVKVLKEKGFEVTGIAADISKEEEVKNLLSKTVEEFGTVDILVNNAGVVSFTRAEELETASFEKTLRVNLVGTFMCSREAGKIMLEKKSGCIVNIASVAAFTAMDKLLSYSVSKAGVISLTRNLAHEWGDNGIRVNAIAPGAIDSGINPKGMGIGTILEQLFNQLCHRALRRGETSDIANAALYLASEDADYVNGEVLTVDGGWTTS